MKLGISLLLVAMALPLTAEAAKRTPTCSNYQKRCYQACSGHQLEPQCRHTFCDKAKRECMRTGIWHTKGYFYRKGMRRK